VGNEKERVAAPGEWTRVAKKTRGDRQRNAKNRKAQSGGAEEQKNGPRGEMARVKTLGPFGKKQVINRKINYGHPTNDFHKQGK